MKRILLGTVLALIVVLALFDVTIDPRFRLPGTETRVDQEQEARYTACYEEREHRFHEEIFERDDNPDVQRELIYRRSQEAKATCREEFPERTIEVELPLDVNVVDLDWRF